MSDLAITPGTTTTTAAPADTPAGITDADVEKAVAEANERLGVTKPGEPPAKGSETTKEAPATEKAAKPDWVEDKFWDADKGEVRTEALAQSYKELQSKNSQAKPAGDKPATETPAELSAALSAAGIDFNAVSTEYAEKGEVAAETRTKLEAAFGKDLVDNYFEGLKAREATAAASYATTVQAAAGGAEAYGKVTAWAADNLPQADIDRFNATVNGGDAEKAALAVQVLKGQYEASGGKPPSLVNGKPAAQGGTGYSSTAEIANAMKDPRYGRDRAYTQEVERKVDASTHLLAG